MRARALAESLDVPLAVSVRGGATAQRAARALGGDLVRTIAAIHDADVLVVDDPSLDRGHQWIARARQAGVRAVSIHDGSRTHRADLVVCASIGASCQDNRSTVLQGPRFYLLDRKITGSHTRPRQLMSPRTPRVLVALGGGSHVKGVAQHLADAIHAACPRAEILVASGFSRGRRKPLRHGRWLSTTDGLASALRECDVAVVAGGVTLYEACALGVPAVGLAVVPAQRRAIRAFAGRGAVVDAGGGAPANRVAAAAAGVARLLADIQLRSAMAARAKRLVDGRGAARVARRIRALLAQGARVA